MYEQGDGVDQAFGEAVRWYRSAAEQGNGNSAFDRDPRESCLDEIG